MNNSNDKMGVMNKDNASEGEQLLIIQKPIRCPGVNRLEFFLVNLGLFFFLSILMPAIQQGNAHPYAPLIIFVLVLFYLFLFAALRFVNIGISLWWLLLLLIPIVNLIIFLFCFFVPSGYGKTLKLNRDE